MAQCRCYKFCHSGQMFALLPYHLSPSLGCVCPLSWQQWHLLAACDVQHHIFFKKSAACCIYIGQKWFLNYKLPLSR